MTEQAQPRQLILAEIFGFGLTPSGDKFSLRIQSDEGIEADIVIPYQLTDDLVRTSLEAANAAYLRRRENNLTDEPTQLVDGTMRIISFQFPYVESREYMLLRALTNKGPIEIRIPREFAPSFAQGAIQGAAALEAPPTGGAN